MAADSSVRSIRALPAPSRLDGDPERMFPLRTAAQAAELLGCSVRHVNNMVAVGNLPYVLLATGKPGPVDDGAEGNRRRFRADHLLEAVQAWTHTA